MRPNVLIRRFSLLLLASCLIAASGCSRIKFAYNSANFVIERYADGYLDLSGAQLSRWEPRLEKSLAKHRSQDLPHLAALLQGTLNASRVGFSPSNMDCLINQMEHVARDHLQIAADTLAPLLADLDARQVRKLAVKFDEEEREERRERARTTPAEAERDRAKRNADSAKWWLGSVTRQQEDIIAGIASRLPDTGEDWDRYQHDKRAGLLVLLNRQSSEALVHAYLTAWFVDNTDLPASLDRARPVVRARLIELFVGLDATLTSAQRAQFQKRLTSLRDDFMELQHTPRMASPVCGG